jgi:hypothetical protein
LTINPYPRRRAVAVRAVITVPNVVLVKNHAETFNADLHRLFWPNGSRLLPDR